MPKLSNHKTWQKRPVHTAIAVVAEAFHIEPSVLRNNGRRNRLYTRRRQVVVWLAMEMGASSSHVGYYMGLDHSTVLYGRAMVRRRCTVDPGFEVWCAVLLVRAGEYLGNNPVNSRAPRAGLGTFRAPTNSPMYRSTVP